MAGAARRSQTQIAALGQHHLLSTEGAPGRALPRGRDLGAVGDIAETAASLHHLPWQAGWTLAMPSLPRIAGDTRVLPSWQRGKSWSHQQQGGPPQLQPP